MAVSAKAEPPHCSNAMPTQAAKDFMRGRVLARELLEFVV
jgi:hypothetical protein